MIPCYPRFEDFDGEKYREKFQTSVFQCLLEYFRLEQGELRDEARIAHLIQGYSEKCEQNCLAMKEIEEAIASGQDEQARFTVSKVIAYRELNPLRGRTGKLQSRSNKNSYGETLYSIRVQGKDDFVSDVALAYESDYYVVDSNKDYFCVVVKGLYYVVEWETGRQICTQRTQDGICARLVGSDLELEEIPSGFTRADYSPLAYCKNSFANFTFVQLLNVFTKKVVIVVVRGVRDCCGRDFSITVEDHVSSEGYIVQFPIMMGAITYRTDPSIDFSHSGPLMVPKAWLA